MLGEHPKSTDSSKKLKAVELALRLRKVIQWLFGDAGIH